MVQFTGEAAEIPWPEVVPVPAEMRAVAFREFGPPEVLKVGTFPVPEIGPDEVLVRVAAVGVGRLLDLIARSGKHPYATFEFPHILGSEHAGTVVAVGEGVTGIPVGAHVAVHASVLPANDPYAVRGMGELSPALRIIGTHLQGADAEYCAVPASNVFLAPEGLTVLDAVGAVNGGAVAMNQFDKAGGVGPGTRVVVHGAASALGSATARLAVHLGAEVIATARGEAKGVRLRELLGNAHTLDATADDFVARAREAFGGHGADVIIDNLGAPTIWPKNFELLEPGGAVVSSGAFLGREVTVNLQRLYSMSQRIIGVRTGNLESARKSWVEVTKGFRGIVDRTFPVAEAAAAHHYVENSENIGRVVLDATTGW
ncbi:MAG TPA: zinc-binding dehydrogenase [Pseudolysinimonas sp.]|nr:zinc-binding dehydrogenase [Pseudolysinimonas sp.]